AEVTVPVSMKEVGGHIEKQVAYLSGGRGEDSSVIITLPECSAFSDIPEEALAKVFTYLTLIPRTRQPGVKFIIILDRRLDTWASIKTALSRIAASFPGNLHLVLVLRPTSFFHRTVTDIGFRFSQEDFMLKMPVVMLSSVTDLLRYIDENQLTSEFGGTLDYCHSDWMFLRTAIESFAVTVKDIAQMLQSFGTELAETELPDDGRDTEHLLETHTAKYRKLKKKKDAIISVSKDGHHLLLSLETSGKEEDAQWDVRMDWETVQRLYTQLRDMELAFDGFFEKHRLKFHQYLQLLRYEQRFQEMETRLQDLISEERELLVSASSLAQTEQVLKRFDSLESNAQEVMSQTQIIVLHGHQLSAGHHYAVALIMQRCNELRHYCDTLDAALKAKRAHLLQTHQLLLCLGQAQTWCDDGAYLLANQLVDKLQSKEGAQAALQDIEKFLEEAPSMLSSGPDVLAAEYEGVITPELQTQIGETFEKHVAVQQMIQNRQACLRKLADKQVRPVQLVAPRPENPPRSKSPFSPKHGKRVSRKSPNPRKIEVIHDYQESRSCVSYGLEGEDSPDLLKRHVMKELFDTERIYVEELLSVLLGYRAEMENPALSSLLPPILHSKQDILFGNMPEIYNFHSRIFLQDLEGCLETPESVGACFLERKESFQMYECYCQNKPRSDALWRQFSDCHFFQECQKNLEHKLGLDSYLLKPVQRLTKYQLLLKELLKYSTDCKGTSELQGALTAMLDLLKSVNDSMHQIAITGYEGDICELGRVLMQGSFSVWISHKRGPTRMKELARFKPMQRHLFLYERALLFCKRREEHGDGGDKTPSYSFKHCLKMTAVGITENVKGDQKKFEIWYSGREEVYVVQAPTVEVKMTWLHELR
uniref:MCF.2 cell line derived transforming sequence a n=1 Tax=Tetraodon nigroviridis TaxID=99883 RepID=H3DHF6_TETNG